MASSGSISKSAAFGNVTLSWSVTSQNVYTKKSTISYRLSIYRRSNISSSADKDYWIRFNGVTVNSGTNTIGGNGTKTLASGTLTLDHNSDGECNFTIAFSQEIAITWSGNRIETLSASGYGSLNKISTPTIPALSASSVEIGSNLTITLNRDKPTYRHKIVYTWGAYLVNMDVAYDVETSYTWQIPLDFYYHIPNAVSGTCYLTVTTYDDGGIIGSNVVSFVATVPASVVPTIDSIELTDTGSDVAASWGKWVQGKSRLHVKVNANGAHWSTITGYQISALGNTVAQNDIDIAILASSGSADLSVTVWDSRGRSATVSRRIEVESYTNPTIETATIERANNAGTPIDNGSYAKIKLKASGSSVAGKNTISAKIYHMRSDLDAWTLARTIPVAYTYDDIVMIANMVASRSYAYKIELSDAFSTTTAEMMLRAEGAVIGWLAGGLGVSFGKAAEEQYTADFDWKLHGRKGAQFDENVDVPSLSLRGVDTLQTIDVVTVGRDSNLEITQSDAYVGVAMNQIMYSAASKLQLSSGGIVIPDDVRGVRVSAQVAAQVITPGARFLHVQIVRGNEYVTVSRTVKFYPSSIYPESMVISPIYISAIQPGDIVILGMYGQTGDIVYNTNYETFMTVEVYA